MLLVISLSILLGIVFRRLFEIPFLINQFILSAMSEISYPDQRFIKTTEDIRNNTENHNVRITIVGRTSQISFKVGHKWDSPYSM